MAGVDQPVEVFELAGRARQDSALDWRLQRSRERGASVLVGRDAERGHLHAALARLGDGRGGVIAVVGAAGLGKSRLLQEFADSAIRQGVPVHQTRASPYERHQAMAAPVALLRSRMQLAPNASADEVRRRIPERFPELAQEHPTSHAFIRDFLGVAAAGELSTEVAVSLREKMTHELARWLPAADTPQLILFEDLHNLGEYTLEFVRQLAGFVAGSKSLLLLSWRDDAAPGGLPPVDLRLQLAPLDAPALKQLADAWLGTDPSLADLSAQLAQRAGGNPFFVEEAVIALAETGHLGGARGDYCLLQPLDQWPMPDSIHALIAARIDRLPAPHKTALQVASVIGAEFDPALLAAMAPELHAEPALRALAAAGFVRADADGRARFVQPLMLEVAYGAQLESSRRLAHARLAGVLEQAAATAPVSEQARVIAHHWTAAGQWAQAGLWNLNAARFLAPRNARATLDQYRAAVENLDRAPASDAVQRARIAARAGIIRMGQFWALDQAEVERTYTEARQLAQACGDPVCAAELMIAYANEKLHRGEAERAVALVVQGVGSCPDAERADLVDRFRLSVLLSHSAVGRIQDGLELVNAAGGTGWLTRPIDADNNLSRAFICLHLAWIGEIARAGDELGQCIAIAERDGRGASWMHAFRADFAWMSGCVDGVLEATGRALEQAQMFGSLYFRAIALRAQGEALMVLGRHAEAIAPLSEAQPLTSRGAGAFQFEAQQLSALSEACLGAGQIELAARWARDAVRSAQDSGSRLWEVRAWIAMLALPRSVLDDAQAQAGFARARELLALTRGLSLVPRVDELEARRVSSETERKHLIERAIAGYQRVGADGHVQRLRSG